MTRDTTRCRQPCVRPHFRSQSAAPCIHGGVRGNAESEIDGRQVFIGSCNSGVLTYHLRYGEDVIVSLTSLGERRFGEQVVQNLGE